MEITNQNFEEGVARFEADLAGCQLAALDFEMTGVPPTTPDLHLGSSTYRYNKIRSEYIAQFQPIQFGISLFKLGGGGGDPAKNNKSGQSVTSIQCFPYTFHLFPDNRCCESSQQKKTAGEEEEATAANTTDAAQPEQNSTIEIAGNSAPLDNAGKHKDDTVISMSTSSVRFLLENNFDFQKCFTRGIGWKRRDEVEAREALESTAWRCRLEEERDALHTKIVAVEEVEAADIAQHQQQDQRDREEAEEGFQLVQAGAAQRRARRRHKDRLQQLHHQQKAQSDDYVRLDRLMGESVLFRCSLGGNHSKESEQSGAKFVCQVARAVRDNWLLCGDEDKGGASTAANHSALLVIDGVSSRQCSTLIEFLRIQMHLAATPPSTPPPHVAAAFATVASSPSISPATTAGELDEEEKEEQEEPQKKSGETARPPNCCWAFQMRRERMNSRFVTQKLTNETPFLLVSHNSTTNGAPTSPNQKKETQISVEMITPSSSSSLSQLKRNLLEQDGRQVIVLERISVENQSDESEIQKEKRAETPRNTLNIAGWPEYQREKLGQLEKRLVQLRNKSGFSRVVRLLSEKKPILIGHNCYLDVAFLVEKFLEPIKPTLAQFKRQVLSHFPRIADTKYFARSIDREGLALPLGKLMYHIEENAAEFPLPPIYFADGSTKYPSDSACFHDAGYDAFCTGKVFLALCSRSLRNRCFKSSLNSILTRPANSPLSFDAHNNIHKNNAELTFDNIKLLEIYNKINIIDIFESNILDLDSSYKDEESRKCDWFLVKHTGYLTIRMIESRLAAALQTWADSNCESSSSCVSVGGGDETPPPKKYQRSHTQKPISQLSNKMKRQLENMASPPTRYLWVDESSMWIRLSQHKTLLKAPAFLQILNQDATNFCVTPYEQTSLAKCSHELNQQNQRD